MLFKVSRICSLLGSYSTIPNYVYEKYILVALLKFYIYRHNVIIKVHKTTNSRRRSRRGMLRTLITYCNCVHIVTVLVNCNVKYMLTEDVDNVLEIFLVLFPEGT